MTEARQPELRQTLRQLERAFESRRLPAGASSRFESRLSRVTAAHRPLERWLAAGLVAAGMVAGIGTWLKRRPVEARPAISMAAGPGFEWTRIGEEVRIDSGEGDLAIDSLRVRMHATAGSELQPEGRGVRMLRGRVLFRVEPRRKGEGLVRITVSHGALEVVGTQFVVVQEADRGWVSVDEGKLMFVAADGQRQPIAAGQKLSWGAADPPTNPPTVAPRTDPIPDDGPAAPPGKVLGKRKGKAGAVFTAAWVRELDDLRIRGRYDELADLLEANLNHVSDPRTKESLSYELAEILATRLHDRARACEHLAKHRVEFSGGKYADEIVALTKRLGCLQEQ